MFELNKYDLIFGDKDLFDNLNLSLNPISTSKILKIKFNSFINFLPLLPPSNPSLLPWTSYFLLILYECYDLSHGLSRVAFSLFSLTLLKCILFTFLFFSIRSF